MHTHTHTDLSVPQMRTVLEALFDLYVRSLFQNPIRLKSPGGEQNREGGGRGEGGGGGGSEARSMESGSNRATGA